MFVSDFTKTAPFCEFDTCMTKLSDLMKIPLPPLADSMEQGVSYEIGPIPRGLSGRLEGGYAERVIVGF